MMSLKSEQASGPGFNRESEILESAAKGTDKDEDDCYTAETPEIRR